MHKARVYLLLFAIAAALGIRGLFFWVSVTHLPATSDESSLVLQAKKIQAGDFKLLMTGVPYQFPVESYWLAPWVQWLPRNAFGSRAHMFLLGLLSLAGFVWVMRQMLTGRTRWAGGLCLFFPSAYVLMLQCAYAVPQHSSLAVLSCLALILGVLSQKTGRWYWAAPAGFVAGLAFSNHALALPLSAACGLWICMGRSFKSALRNTMAFLPGLLAGLLPWLAASLMFQGSAGAMTQTHPLGKALERFWTFFHTVPRSLGLAPTVFPDIGSTLLARGGSAIALAGSVFVVVIAAVTAIRLYRASNLMLQRRWPALEILDACVLASWLNMFIFMLSTRAHSDSYRFLLPLAWCFPFILCGLYEQCRGLVKRLLEAGIGAYAAVNLVTAAFLMLTWTRPGFAEREALTPDIRPVIRCLQQQGFEFAYSTFWVSFRIPFETDEGILCAQLYNQRFPNWPAPYKTTVDRAGRVAYVFAPFQDRKFGTKRFEDDLRRMGALFRKTVCGRFSVYEVTGFRRPYLKSKIYAGHVEARASHRPDDAGAVTDGNSLTCWNSGSLQETGMWIDLDLKKKTRLAGLSLLYTAYPHDRAKSLRILVSEDGTWTNVVEDLPDHIEPFAVRSGHPVYGDILQTVRFQPVWAERVRIEVLKPNEARNWSVSEVELWREKQS